MVWQKFKVNSNLQLNVLFSEVVDYIECYSCEEGEQDLQYGINGNWKIVKVLNNSSKVAFSRRSEKDRYLILCTNQKDFNDVFKNANASFDSDLFTLKPYIEDKTQILLDEPLMRLPNGVCDEITRDRKLIRRVGKVVLDGSENWIYHNSNSNTISTYIYWLAMDGFDRKLSGDNAICDNAVVGKNSEYTSIGFVTSGFCYLNVLKTTLDNNGDVISLKSYLAQNPITVYYELAEPVITELPAPYLRIFKDGHLTFNTLVAPESTHVVQLNKSGQIQNAIKESQSLDNRINVLENNYDNLILFTMSRLNDLELNYTLK